MLIGLGKDKTLIDFGFTRSKVMVTWVTCKNKIKWFPLIILRIIYHRAFQFHMLNGLGEDMTCIDLGFTRSSVKVTMVIFCKTIVSAQYLEKHLSQSHYIPHAD